MQVACGEQRQKGASAFGNHLLQQPIKKLNFIAIKIIASGRPMGDSAQGESAGSSCTCHRELATVPKLPAEHAFGADNS